MQAIFIQPGREIDHTPAGNIAAGQVVVQVNLVGIAKEAIAAGVKGALSVAGIFDVRQVAEIIAAGSPVYWDADGNPSGGANAGTGAATLTATGNTFMGFAQALTAAADLTVRVALRSAETVAGGVATATSITGSAATLAIAGLPAATGTAGAVTLAGGAGTAGNATGGALTLTGGAKDGSGTAGALVIGATNTASVAIGAATIATTIGGNLIKKVPIVDATASTTLAAGHSGSTVILNTGDVVTLPAVAGLAGVYFDFVTQTEVTTAPQIDPAGSEVINVLAANQTGGKYIEPTAIGDSLRLICDGTIWRTAFVSGTWAVQG